MLSDIKNELSNKEFSLIYYKENENIKKLKEWEYKLELWVWLLYNVYITAKNWYFYTCWDYFIKLDYLKALWVIKDYIFIPEKYDFEKIKNDLWNHVSDNNFAITEYQFRQCILNFKWSIWEYNIHYNENKVSIFYDIVFWEVTNKNYKCSIALIKFFSEILENFDIDINEILDYLKLDNDNFLFYEIELLIYSIASYKDYYVAKLLNYIYINIENERKYINKLKKILKLDNKFYLITEKDNKNDLTKLWNDNVWMIYFNNSNKSNKLEFNIENWEVSIITKIIDTIPPWTRAFKLFKILYENYNKRIEFRDIVDAMWMKNKSDTELQGYCNWIKRELPQKIKKYIKTVNNAFLLMDKPQNKAKK